MGLFKSVIADARRKSPQTRRSTYMPTTHRAHPSTPESGLASEQSASRNSLPTPPGKIGQSLAGREPIYPGGQVYPGLSETHASTRSRTTKAKALSPTFPPDNRPGTAFKPVTGAPSSDSNGSAVHTSLPIDIPAVGTDAVGGQTNLREQRVVGGSGGVATRNQDNVLASPAAATRPGRTTDTDSTPRSPDPGPDRPGRPVKGDAAPARAKPSAGRVGGPRQGSPIRTSSDLAKGSHGQQSPVSAKPERGSSDAAIESSVISADPDNWNAETVSGPSKALEQVPAASTDLRVSKADDAPAESPLSENVLDRKGRANQPATDREGRQSDIDLEAIDAHMLAAQDKQRKVGVDAATAAVEAHSVTPTITANANRHLLQGSTAVSATPVTNPEVRIGQVDVFIEAQTPSKSRKGPDNRPASTLVSRHYLRRL